MNAEYHRRLRLDDYRTFDEYLRERIRRGLQAHHDHTEMLLHLQDQYRAVRAQKGFKKGFRHR